MLEARFFSPEEMHSYKYLFIRCFGYWDNKHTPEIVAVMELDRDPIAFLSGRWNSKDLFYIQYCGVVPEQRIKNASLFLTEGLKLIGAAGFTTYTPNDNQPAMKVLLNLGFRVIGIRFTEDRKILVEWGWMKSWPS